MLPEWQQSTIIWYEVSITNTFFSALFPQQKNTFTEVLDLTGNYIESVGAAALAKTLVDNCFITELVSIVVIFDSNARSQWLNRGHVDEFKSNTPQLVNFSKNIDQPVNIAVARHVWEHENLIIVVYFVCAI